MDAMGGGWAGDTAPELKRLINAFLQKKYTENNVIFLKEHLRQIEASLSTPNTKVTAMDLTTLITHLELYQPLILKNCFKEISNLYKVLSSSCEGAVKTFPSTVYLQKYWQKFQNEHCRGLSKCHKRISKNDKRTHSSGTDSSNSRAEMFSLLQTENSKNETYLAQLIEIRNVMDTIPNGVDIPRDLAKIRKLAKEPGKASNSSIAFLMSILIKGMKVTRKIVPRDTQLVSVLSMVLSQGGKGRLEQIGTGEGKSVTIAMLASYFALKGKKVDVVTCSAVLAKRDSDTFEEFFTLLGLSSGAVSGNQVRKGEGMACYLHDILYGTTLEFQGDVLCDKFALLNRRGGRPFDVVIVDEVDSMLIDQGGHSTRLLSKMPGMEHLEPVYLSIWNYLEDAETLLFEYGEDLFQLLPETLGNTFTECLAKATGSDEQLMVKALNEFAAWRWKECNNSPDGRKALEIFLGLGQSRNFQLGGNNIQKEIEEMWHPSTQQGYRAVAEFYFGKIISVFVLDEEMGFIPSKEFHASRFQILLSEDDIDDEEFEMIFLQTDKGIFHTSRVPDRRRYLDDYITCKVKNRIGIAGKLSNGKNSEPKLLIPSHLETVFTSKLAKWIESAITAKSYMDEKRDYILKLDDASGETKIRVVDYAHTGVVEENMVWDEGVQQFLQIKHKLALSPEQFVTNCISNLVYFKEYGTNIYGLTGTLGSDQETDMLSTLYNVDTVRIPAFIPKRHDEFGAIPAQNEEQWLGEIANSVVSQAKLGKGILIVCSSIQDVDKIENYLNSIRKKEKTKMVLLRYTGTDLITETKAIDKPMKPGTVIIATNLAGRGTDIRLDDTLVQNGGLHICITFLPVNQRVENQAIGRASRMGQPGTSQLIFIIEGNYSENIADIKYRRDKEEVQRIKNIISTTIAKLVKSAEGFEKYLSVRNAKREYLRTHISSNELIIGHGVSSLDEQWGILLNLSTPDSVNDIVDQVEKLGESFLETGNFHYHILIGNEYNKTNNFTKAVSSFDDAIKMDPAYAALAHYYKAYSIICNGGNSQIAQKELKECWNKIVTVQIPNLIGCHILAAGSNSRDILSELASLKDNSKLGLNNDDAPFTKQIVNKINLFLVIADTIQQAFDVMSKVAVVTAELIDPEEYFEGINSTLPKTELKELEEAGMCGFIKISKKLPAWYTIFVVIAVGVLETAAGVAVMFLPGGMIFGASLVVEGLLDITKGITAAINGDYFTLGDFFKDKAIMIGISLLASGLAKVVAKAAKFVTAFVSKLSSKFFSTGFGSFIKSIGKGIGNTFGKLWDGCKSFVNKGVQLAKSVGNTILQKVKSTLAVVSGLARSVGATATRFLAKGAKHLGLDKAMTFLKKLWLKGGSAFKAGWNVIKRKTGYSQLPPEVKEGLNLVAKEVAIIAGNEGIGYAYRQALSAITKMVQANISQKLKPKCLLKQIKSQTISQYFDKAKNAEEFEELKKQFLDIVRHEINEEAINNTSYKNIVNSICDVAGNLGKVIRDQRSVSGRHNWFVDLLLSPTILANISDLIIQLSKLGGYVDQVFKLVEHELSKINVPKSQPSITSYKPGGMRETAAGVAELISEEITARIMNMVKPFSDYGVNVVRETLRSAVTKESIQRRSGVIPDSAQRNRHRLALLNSTRGLIELATAPIVSAIETHLSEKIKGECMSNLLGTTFVTYFSQAIDKVRFEKLRETFLTFARSAIHDFGNRRVPSSLQNILNSLNSTSKDAQRILLKENTTNSKDAALLVKSAASIIEKSTHFGVLVDHLKTYVDDVFTQIRQGLVKGETITLQFPYIKTVEGAQTFMEDMESISTIMGKLITGYMMRMIQAAGAPLVASATASLKEKIVPCPEMMSPRSLETTHVQILSEETGRPVEVYRRNESSNAVELCTELSWEYGSECDERRELGCPIRVGLAKYKSGATRIDLVLCDPKNAEMRMVAIDTTEVGDGNCFLSLALAAACQADDGDAGNFYCKIISNVKI